MTIKTMCDICGKEIINHREHNFLFIKADGQYDVIHKYSIRKDVCNSCLKDITKKIQTLLEKKE